MSTYFLEVYFYKYGKEIQGVMHLRRIKGQEDSTLRPCAISVFINEDSTRHKLKETGNWDTWISSSSFDGNFANPDTKNFGDIKWGPLTCLLWIEFETFGGGERNALQQLTELYVKQIQCDVQFSFDDDEDIGGHSNILTARSPVFAAMFQHEMKETKTGQVYIEDIKPDIFKQLLHFIYSGRLLTPLTEMSEITAKGLFEAADKYDIGDLKEECVSFLLTCVRLDNVINLMAWAHIHLVDELKEKALTFTSLHGKEISPQKDWENLTKYYPEVCLEATRRIIGRMSLSSESSN